MIEVELRGFLSKNQYLELSSRLKAEADNFEDDDKYAHFFKYENGILKIVDEVSKNQKKISLKVGNELSINGLHEVEVYLKDQDDFNLSLEMFKLLGFETESEIHQKRTNYMYKDTVISLKYTESWSYHFEIEKVVAEESDVNEAKRQIKDVCKELGITPLNENELAAFLKSLRK